VKEMLKEDKHLRDNIMHEVTDLVNINVKLNCIHKPGTPVGALPLQHTEKHIL
jgi:hypothetical protein